MIKIGGLEVAESYHDYGVMVSEWDGTIFECDNLDEAEDIAANYTEATILVRSVYVTEWTSVATG